MNYSPLLTGSALALLLGLSGCGLADTSTAESEVDRFHKHWNADEINAIHDEAHPNFRTTQSAEQLIAGFKEVKTTYGAFKSATRRSVEIHTKNDVKTIRLQYDSTYERGAAVETFFYRMADGKPLLAYYNLESPEDAKKSEAEKKTDQ